MFSTNMSSLITVSLSSLKVIGYFYHVDSGIALVHKYEIQLVYSLSTVHKL